MTSLSPPSSFESGLEGGGMVYLPSCASHSSILESCSQAWREFSTVEEWPWAVINFISSYKREDYGCLNTLEYFQASIYSTSLEGSIDQARLPRALERETENIYHAEPTSFCWWCWIISNLCCYHPYLLYVLQWSLLERTSLALEAWGGYCDFALRLNTCSGWACIGVVRKVLI